MAQVIGLDGLPDPVATAITETVHNLKSGYRVTGGAAPGQSGKLTAAEADRALEELLDTLPSMPSLFDKALSRENIYAPEDDTR